MKLCGREKHLFASEVRAACYCFDAETGERETVWENEGGTMGMEPLPGCEDRFLAIRGFFPPFAAADSDIALVTKTEEGFTVEPYLQVPYLHRFGIVTTDRGSWLVLAVLCETKANKDDWSSPGYVAAAPLENGKPGTPVRLLGGQFHNHGFAGCTFRGNAAVLTSSDAGAYAFTAPHGDTAEWKVERLTDVPTGEVRVCDMDGDGVEELITLEGFHGTDLKVWHLDENGKYAPVWQYPEPLAFVHPLWAGELWGKMCGISGGRRENGPLFLFRYEDGAYRTELIEDKAFSANVTVAERNGKQVILSANHGQNTCVMYTNED